MNSNLSELIARAQQGDKDAFGQIYQIFLARIFRFIYFQVRNYQLAQDLTQNTFLRVFGSLSKFNLKRGSFQAFLFKIAKNLIRKKIEKPGEEEKKGEDAKEKREDDGHKDRSDSNPQAN